MRPDPQFVEAFVHDEIELPDGFWWRQKILGYHLRPFSIWHQALLIAVESPLISGESIDDPKQLLQAIHICRSIYPRATIKPPRHPIRDAIALAGGGLKRGRDLFDEYVGDYSARPDFQIVNPPPQPGSRIPDRLNPPTAPMRIAGDLITWSHWPEDVVWNLRVGAAAWYDTFAMKASGNNVDFSQGGTEEWLESDPELQAAAAKAAEDYRTGNYEF